MPGPEELQAIRAAIAADPGGFLAMVEARGTRKLFGPLQGEKLSRVPKAWQAHANTAAAGYLKFKQFYWWVELPAAVALTPRLAGVVVRHFRAMREGMEWFNRAILADRRKREGDGRPMRPTPMW